MKEAAQFMVRGVVTQVQDVCTLKGVPVVHVFLAVGGGGAKVAQAFRVEVYDEALRAVAHGLRRGRPVQCSGRLAGRVSDRGFYNCSLYADAFLVEPEAGGGGNAAPDHFRGTTQKVGAAPRSGAAEEGLAAEDIPF